MKLEQINGRGVYVVDALLVRKKGEKPVEVKFGILPEQLGKHASRGKGTAIAQFYMIVSPGLIRAKHIFRGLERPLFCDGDMHADESKLVYSWKPKKDYEWKGDRFSGQTEERVPPQGRVFVTIVSPNRDKSFPGIDGWIEHWNWVHESSDLSNAPVESEKRYKEKLWSNAT